MENTDVSEPISVLNEFTDSLRAEINISHSATKHVVSKYFSLVRLKNVGMYQLTQKTY